MDIYVLNKAFEPIAVIDALESVIWTDRYRECGDFELYSPMTEALKYITIGSYLSRKDSEHLMIVERFDITTSEEEGNHVTITGRSLESILDRRIAWGQTILSGNFQTAIKKLLTDNIINPAIAERKIPNFIFEDSTDSRITSLEIEAQYFGENIYDIIFAICEEQDLGFKITLNANKQFVFKLYFGTDRSFDQTAVPYVLFSPSFENLLNSSYSMDYQGFKTSVLVGGEGEGTDKRLTSVEYEQYEGLDRRELYVEASDISSNNGEITAAEYDAQLEQRGFETLAEYESYPVFDGELDTTLSYKYGTDFFMGDIVQVENEYKMQGKCRVTEMIMSENGEGIKNYPTFSAIQ